MARQKATPTPKQRSLTAIIREITATVNERDKRMARMKSDEGFIQQAHGRMAVLKQELAEAYNRTSAALDTL